MKVLFFRSQKSSKNIILFPFFDTEIERNRIEGKNIDFSDVLYSVVTFWFKWQNHLKFSLKINFNNIRTQWNESKKGQFFHIESERNQKASNYLMPIPSACSKMF